MWQMSYLAKFREGECRGANVRGANVGGGGDKCLGLVQIDNTRK